MHERNLAQARSLQGGIGETLRQFDSLLQQLHSRRVTAKAEVRARVVADAREQRAPVVR